MESIKQWRKRALPTAPRPAGAVLYPFSGSDLPNVYSFFPNAPAYVMVALEEPGERPLIESIGDAELRSGLGSLQDTVRGIARNNYLFTRTISRMARNPHVHGAAPTLLAYLARLGTRAESIVGVRMAGDGSIQLDTTREHPGVRIGFSRPDGSCSVLYYFRLRVTNSIADPKSPEGGFLAGIEPVQLFMKSAAYVMHSHFAPTERAAVAFRDRSELVVQDDSGLPARLFEPSVWRRTVFGRYSTYRFAIQDIGRPPRQQILQELFIQQKPEPLPFRFGYGALRGKAESNLMVFQRKGPEAKSN